MFLTPRDQLILRFVADFRLVSTSEVSAFIFKENKSDTPAYRRLRKLKEHGFLRLVELRPIGGSEGGSAQHVFALGTEGRKLFRPDTWIAPRLFEARHTRDIVKAFMAVEALNGKHGFSLRHYATDPNNHQVFRGVELRPDLYIELDDVNKRMTHAWWLEVDRSNERSDKIRGKLEQYYAAYKNATDEEVSIWPRVIFLVPDAARRQGVRRYVSSMPEEAGELFDVQLLSDFPRVLL